MRGLGRTVGLILVAASVLICGITVLFLGAQFVSDEVTLPGAILGLVIVTLVLVLPLGGAGVFLFTRGKQEIAEFQEVEKEKKILNMVLAQGKVTIGEMVAELQVSRDQVEDMIRKLVGKGLFSGAINWQQGVLYSKETAMLKEDRKCPNCGGQVELAGKGIVRCPYCGSEVFLSH